ncbi:unnamed protein product [Lampetra fluviatilis]
MSAYNLLRLVSHPRSGPLLPSEVKRREQRARVTFAPEELRRRLTTLQFHVTQQRGTERPFSGELTLHSAAGTYGCLVCGAALFTSESKFDSGSGWPSFSEAVTPHAVALGDDVSGGVWRVEASCSQCGSHLGHLFDDGPRPSRRRFCVNSTSLSFCPRPGGPSDAGRPGPAPAGHGGGSEGGSLTPPPAETNGGRRSRGAQNTASPGGPAPTGLAPGVARASRGTARGWSCGVGGSAGGGWSCGGGGGGSWSCGASGGARNVKDVVGGKATTSSIHEQSVHITHDKLNEEEEEEEGSREESEAFSTAPQSHASGPASDDDKDDDDDTTSSSSSSAFVSCGPTPPMSPGGGAAAPARPAGAPTIGPSAVGRK